jgi:transposase-like protein
MRLEAIRLVQEEGLSRSAAAKKLGVSSQTVINWAGGLGLERPNLISEEQKQKAYELFAAGHTKAKIARDLNVSQKGIARWINLHFGLTTPKKPRLLYPEDMKAKALSLLESGNSITAVAKELGVPGNRVWAWRDQAKQQGKTIGLAIEKSTAKGQDINFTWITRDYLEYDAWREPMAEWAKGKRRNLAGVLNALITFVIRYLVPNQLPTSPAEYLRRTPTPFPDFYSTTCRPAHKGVQSNNHIHEFLQWVLIREFSEFADDGARVISPVFRNPVPLVSSDGIPSRSESEKDPLPYGFIADARQILAQGPHFKDWLWAQHAGGNTRGHNAGDWFKVTEDRIDRDDPDCVWRRREFLTENRPSILEMWSPVRWVALLIKLQLPPRTFQVRMVDSGESDTWRFTTGQWVLNDNPLATGTKGNPWRQGIFRRVEDTLHNETMALYFNTNKTADALKSGKEKGQEIPWPVMEEQPIENQPYYWLEKLRNWQEKYNPIKSRTAWATIPLSVLAVPKSEAQLSAYPDTCFLFRAPENAGIGRGHLPVTAGELHKAWFKVLAELEERIAKSGITLRDGSRLRLVKPGSSATTYFPLHCLRVSLITELATTGGVPMELLVKIVGHSRLVMTLYYTKPGYKYMQDALIGAAERLDANKEHSIVGWLANAERDELLMRVVFNGPDEFEILLPVHPANRNPVGWMLMHHGICLAGGNNATEMEPNYALKGCHNGGTQVPGKGKLAYKAVAGGARNCIRCRWFVTEPHYVPALAAHLNNLLYHLCDVRATTIKYEAEVTQLKNERYDVEATGIPFAKSRELGAAERRYESAMERIVGLAKDVTACNDLIRRCSALQARSTEGATSLVAIGDATEVRAIIEETDSELLQLSGVCQDVEVYADLNAGKAVFRQSQFLDSLLMREGGAPFFMALSEEEQLKCGNAFMRKLAQQADPTHPMIGFRRVCGLIDSGGSLAQFLGVDIQDLLPAESEPAAQFIPIRIRKGGC